MADAFRDDIAAQGRVVREIEVASQPGAELDRELSSAAALLGDAGRPLVMFGMGGSLHAIRTILPRLARIGRFAVAVDAGELAHFGMSGLPHDAILMAVSQSGRSAETLAVVEALRSSGADRPIVALVNDLDSPIAQASDAVVVVRAGEEAAVATKTFIATSVVMQLLADAVAEAERRGRPGPADGEAPARDGLVALADELDRLASDDGGARAAADILGQTKAIELVGRGPTLGVAGYGALTIKEVAAFPAEVLAGGEFRHGPLELVEAPAGAIVLVPVDPAAGSLLTRLATEIADAGWPTVVLGPGDPSMGPLADLSLAVRLQQIAASLAERRGRVPGILRHGSKVTTTE